MLINMQGLGWPANRNEFLQILIRKNWDRTSFEDFCTILGSTQPIKLKEQVIGKAESYIEGDRLNGINSHTFNEKCVCKSSCLYNIY